MIRSAFAAYSPGQPEPVAAQLPAAPSPSPVQQWQKSVADTPLAGTAAPAMAMSIAEWDILFCAVTERLRTFAATGLAQSGSAHEEAKAKMQLLSLDCALALELLHKILLDGRPADAAAARKFDDENN